jgi:hypothetical protein
VSVNPVKKTTTAEEVKRVVALNKLTVAFFLGQLTGIVLVFLAKGV